MPPRRSTLSQFDQQYTSENQPLLGAHGRSITFAEQAVAAKHSGAAPEKLGTYEGVFLPTTLNVLSILMFLRFGFIIGQAGAMGSLLLLVASYAINLLTSLSISAIATNGTVRGGGAYYMISRSLGPEFGGSVGVIFYIGQVLNAALNIAGFAVPLLSNFGRTDGAIAKILPDSAQWGFFYQTLLLWICLIICAVGPSLFARSSKLLFYILISSTLSLPVSAVFVKPFFSKEFGAWYTGFSLETLRENLLPHFTKGAVGSEIPGKENFRDLFGIFFPATAGIFAGASMSGDLTNPSRSIPKGTLYGIALTFVLYCLVIISISGSCSRDLLYRDLEVMRDSNISPVIVVMGEFATSLFSAMMGILGAAKLLQAISRDSILPYIEIFGIGTEKEDNPLWAIFFTYVLTQFTILLPINKIAVFITMAFLITFVVINTACLLLKLSSAPNFRPSFKYFSATTTALGCVASLLAMFVADGLSALLALFLTAGLFISIHFYTPPKAWGDVSQMLIYHQVRKYLLKLRSDHVKYWRPQILLFVDDPRTSWSLIKFCSHLKKGGLFIIGHVVIVTDNFKHEYAEVEKQRSAWKKLRDACGIKAFIHISASQNLVWGIRNVTLGSGLGGMKPNITVLGFYGEKPLNVTHPDLERLDINSLPTDSCRSEAQVSVSQWVNIIEDQLTMKNTVAIARGFNSLEYPTLSTFHESKLSREKGYIDLYPIQMSAVLVDQEGQASGYSINFDTYTLILQLGAILHTVPVWRKTHNLRVVAFVDKESEKEREKKRILELLDRLRIPAEVKVVPLQENNYAYDVIVKGHPDTEGIVSKCLGDMKWWQKLSKIRSSDSYSNKKAKIISIVKGENANQMARYVLPDGDASFRKRRTLSRLEQLGVSHSFTATQWRQSDLNTFYDTDNDDEDDDSDQDSLDEFTSKGDFKSGSEVASMIDGPDVSDPSGGPSVREPVVPAPRDAPQPSVAFGNVRTSEGNTLPIVGKEIQDLQFNDLPAKAQHLILNTLMKKESKDAVVLFSTLPAPAFGTHSSEKRADDYIQLLETFCAGLPPIVMIHSQSMTVTTSL